MKKTNQLIILFAMLLVAGVLSSCAGGGTIANSWPGLIVDPQTNTIYLASSAHVYAINLENGTERWRFPAKADNKVSFYAPPALGEDGLLVAGAFDHVLYGINSGNGQQVWSFAEAKDKYVAQALAVNGNIYAPNSDNTLYAVNQAGLLKWKFRSDHALWSPPLTDGKLIFVASMDHHVYALDPESGKLIWESEDLGGAIVGSFSLSPEGVLFVGTIDGQMLALDGQNGKVIWSAPTGGWVWSTPVMADSTIYFGDLDGNVFALDAANGSVRWQIQPDQSANRQITGAAVISEDTLYFASKAGVLYAVDRTTGNPRWNKVIGGKIYSNLLLAADTIIIAPMEFDAALVAVDLQGNTRWSYTPAK